MNLLVTFMHSLFVRFITCETVTNSCNYSIANNINFHLLKLFFHLFCLISQKIYNNHPQIIENQHTCNIMKKSFHWKRMTLMIDIYEGHLTSNVVYITMRSVATTWAQGKPCSDTRDLCPIGKRAQVILVCMRAPSLENDFYL